MPRNELVFPANQVGNESVVTPGRMRQLDQRASEGLNLVDGGSWSPTSKIWIGGQGVAISGSDRAFSKTVETGTKGRGLILDVGAFPARTHDAYQTRSLVVPITAANLNLPIAQIQDLQYVRDPYGLKDVSSGTNLRSVVMHLPQMRMHNGATLERVSVAMRYGKKPATASLSASHAVPFARIVRWSFTGSFTLPPSANTFDLYVIPVFQNSHPYVLGDIVLDPDEFTLDPTQRRQYRVVVAGTSASGLPSWTSTIGANVVSGGVTFRTEPRPIFSVEPVLGKQHFATLPFASTMEATATNHFQNGLPFDLSFVPNNQTVIDTDDFAYALEILTLGETLTTFHSVKLDFQVPQSMKEP